MSDLLPAFLQPTLYTVTVAIVLAFYLVWALSRQQYLGAYQQFDVLVISLSVGLVTAFIVQLFYPGHLVWPWPAPQIATSLGSQFTVVSLFAAYMLAIAAAWRYIIQIHYPFWRVMDSNLLGISLIQLGWLAGAVIQQYSIPLVIGTLGWALIYAALLVIYHRTNLPGLVSGLHVVGFWVMVIATHYTLVSWQGTASIVEYALAGTAVLAGLVVVASRWRVNAPSVAKTQLPFGVSHMFRDTFNRYIGSKQPSKKGGASD